VPEADPGKAADGSRYRPLPSPTWRRVVVAGDADIVRPEHAVEVYRLLPHAQLAMLPGTDHMTLMARADRLVPMIERFLDAPAPVRGGGPRGIGSTRDEVR